MDFRDLEWSTMDWIDLAEDGDQWRALVKTALNLQILQNVRIFFNN
jgi:hypothetical protein